MVRQALILPALGSPPSSKRSSPSNGLVLRQATRSVLARSWRGWAIGLLVALVSPASGLSAAEPHTGLALYQSQVRPLLNSRCVACHGALKQSGGLRLDTAALTRQGGDSGPAIDLGEPAASLMLEKVALATEENASGRMPPEGEPLTAEQQAALRQWISEGAPAPADEVPESDPSRHWAFQPIVRPAVPTETGGLDVRNPIDAFLASGQHRLKLRPLPEADRLTLLRRLSLDLTGLPPAPAELDHARQAPEGEWFTQAVDRLLSHPGHGERWGRHAMDLWRYSDWWGLGDQLRNSQKHIWHWRDWIVESLNAGVPYDEMVRQMLAADELYPTDPARLRATGFLARNYFLFNRNQWLDETVEHVSKSFLGLTFNCAKCHDHKYDPISQIDYYRMRAFFEPYHARLDVLPDEPDLNRNGLPRVFDGHPDEPTWLFVRGNESQPDKSTPLTPGLPVVLQTVPLEIAPVELPLEAWQPDRQPWVAQGAVRTAERRLSEAHAQLEAAAQKRTQARLRWEAEVERERAAPASTEPATPAPVRLTCAELPTGDWKLFGGDWKVVDGQLEQQQDGPQRAVLRYTGETPRDFEATLKFTILGGSQWRSVGLAFDDTLVDPLAPARPEDGEQLAYVSANTGEPKLQFAWHKGGQYQYPAEGKVNRPFELKREYTLQVRVRETLVNVALDGQPVLAYRTPVERRAGAFEVIAFDALVRFHEVTLAPLAAASLLDEPGQPAGGVAAAQHQAERAHWEWQVAERSLAVAEAELRSVTARQQASQQLVTQGLTAVAADAPAAVLAAAQGAVAAERELAATRGLQRLVEAEAKRLRVTAANEREAAEKELVAARDAQGALQAKIAEPGTEFTRFVGAQWTPTRFFNSSKDDPEVRFQPRSTGRRRALAAWLTDRRHPLFARVAVNQLWQRHFGTPLMPTLFDFGRKPPVPVQRELLDWLAAEFIDSGFDLKHMHRLLVGSAAWRRSSVAGGEPRNLEIDRDNAWYWRRPVVRLESQAVRDALLSLSARLENRQGGPPVEPAQQPQSGRRSLYFFHSNNDRNLFLTMFDEALVKECYRREESIVPQQALALLNSQPVHDAAPAIERVLCNSLGSATGRLEGEALDAAFIQHAFRVLLASEPGPGELDATQRAFAEWRALPEAQPDPGRHARINLVWVLINHNDFVSLR